jgi:hypothetical protein
VAARVWKGKGTSPIINRSLAHEQQGSLYLFFLYKKIIDLFKSIYTLVKIKANIIYHPHKFLEIQKKKKKITSQEPEISEAPVLLNSSSN